VLKAINFKVLKIKKPINLKCKRKRKRLFRRRDKKLKIDRKMHLKKHRMRLKPNKRQEQSKEECKRRIELEEVLN